MKTARISLRLPDDTRKELKVAAAKLDRSLNELIVDILQGWIEQKRYYTEVGIDRHPGFGPND